MDTFHQQTEGPAANDNLEEDQFVAVREYLRYRLLRWETVREHKRRWPWSNRGISGNE